MDRNRRPGLHRVGSDRPPQIINQAEVATCCSCVQTCRKSVRVSFQCSSSCIHSSIIGGLAINAGFLDVLIKKHL